METHIERIRELREDNNLKQKDIADILQTTQQVYSRYEKGINEIPVRHIITLSKYYNVSCDYILEQTDIKQKNDNLQQSTATQKIVTVLFDLYTYNTVLFKTKRFTIHTLYNCWINFVSTY